MSVNQTATSDYSLLMDMIKDAKEQYNMFKDLMDNGFKNDSISLVRAQYLFNACDEKDIESMDSDVAIEMFEKIQEKPDFKSEDEKSVTEWEHDLCKDIFASVLQNDGGEDYKDWVKNVREKYDSTNSDSEKSITEEWFEEHYDELKVDLIKMNLVRICKDIKSLDASKKEVDDLVKQSDDLTEEYQKFMCSPEYEQKKQEQIDKLRKELAEYIANSKNTDGERFEIRRMGKKLDELEKIRDLSFLNERLKTYGDIEVSMIVRTYFDPKKSSYIVEKFKKNISMVGFNPNIYRYFFNIEENYLDKEYSVYNNLFLFIVMRYIGYRNAAIDTDKAYIRTIVSSMSKLIYEKFNDSQKENFLNIIKETLGYFKDYHDKFEKENILHKDHPRRIEREQKEQEVMRKLIFDKLKENGKTDEEIESMEEYSLEQLKEKYDEVMTELASKEEEKKYGDLKPMIEKVKVIHEENSSEDTEAEDSAPVETVETEEEVNGEVPATEETGGANQSPEE